MDTLDPMTYTAVREKLAETLDRVCDDHAPVLVTRRKGRSVVMMSLEDYNSIMETMYLLSSPANAAALMESIAEIEKGENLREWPSGRRVSRRKRSR